MVLFTVTDLDTIKHRYKLNSCGVCSIVGKKIEWIQPILISKVFLLYQLQI